MRSLCTPSAVKVLVKGNCRKSQGVALWGLAPRNRLVTQGQ